MKKNTLRSLGFSWWSKNGKGRQKGQLCVSWDATSAREFLCRIAVVRLDHFCIKVDKTGTENITLSLDLSSLLKVPL